MKTAQEKNILFIEDDPTYAMLVTEALTSSPCRHVMEIVRTLKEGLEKLDHTHFDLILLDLSLPASAGITTVDTLIEKAAQLPIVVLADMNDIQFASLAIQKGVQDFLIKEEIPASALVRILDNAMMRNQSQLAIQHTIENLKKINKRILDQQKSVVEEERLKMMLQMAGATAHELNQPLMSLLGYIELIELSNDKPEKHLAGIKKSGERISAIVKKIQSIRLDCVIPHTGGPGIINIDQTITLLSIEDSDHDFGRLEEILKNQSQINLLRVKSIQEAFEIIKTHPVELVFLDHILPDGTSFDFIRILDERQKELPVVVITGQGDEVLASRIIQAGAYDYINKSNLNLSSVTRMVKNALEKFHLKQEMQKAVDKLAKMAARDELTNLSNRRQLNETIEWEMSRLLRYGNDLTCLMIDLDHFKQINDYFGHDFGDQVLKEFARRLQKSVQSVDMIFRYGGEEFVVLLPKTDLYDGVQIAEKIRTSFEKKSYQYAGQSIVITVSIGVASGIHHRLKEGKILLSLAEKALYTAKANGRNQVQIYPPPLDSGTESMDLPIQNTKEQIKLLLEKTRKSAIAAIERLVFDRRQKACQTETQRVLYYLELLAEKLNFPAAILDTLKQAAQLHDYIQVILMESLPCQETPLREADKAEIEEHLSAISETLDLFDFFSDIRQVLRYHHEHYDGSGYPLGLRGDQIPIGARLLTVVYALISMTSEKRYQRIPDEQIIKALVNGARTQFDPLMVALTLDMIAQHKLLHVSQKEMEDASRTVAKICKSKGASLKDLIWQKNSIDSERLKLYEDQ